MKRRILLADDSVTIQKVIELTFMDEDYEVRAVSNGDEALALLPEMNPDFVIADVHMPGANGYEVCRRSKQLRPEAPVLLLVGTFEAFDEAQARSAGADSFLKKPFDSQELLQRVQELLAPAAAASAAPAAAPAPAAVMPPLAAVDELPDFSAEPAWGNFDLPAEGGAPAAAAAADEATPFDREPSFTLDTDLTYEAESEPVFELEESMPALSVREEVFAAPSELSLDETRQDRYRPEMAAPEPPPAPGFAPAPTAPAAAPAPAAANGGARLSDEDVDRVARRLAELLGDKAVRDVAWEVVPDLAEVIIRDRLRELEAQVE